ncbi:hypothetical protein JCM1841_005509 [Sporobolomyces salmonicolor]
MLWYKATIANVYQQPVSLGINRYPHPNLFPELSKLLKQVKSEMHKIKRSKYVDRGIGSRMATKIFTRAHYALLHSNDVLPIEFADVFPVDLPNKGPSPCFATVVLIDNGKTNQNGRVKYGTFIFNSDPEICSVGALAVYLFLRFHSSQETFPPHNTNFPSFALSKERFDVKLLLAHQSPLATVNYNTFLTSVCDKLKKIGLAAKAKMHIFRGSASRMADLAGANKLDIRSAALHNIVQDKERGHQAPDVLKIAAQ